MLVSRETCPHADFCGPEGVPRETAILWELVPKWFFHVKQTYPCRLLQPIQKGVPRETPIFQVCGHLFKMLVSRETGFTADSRMASCFT